MLFLIPRLHDTTGCQAGCTTGLGPAVSCKQTSNRLSNRLSNWFDNRLNVRIHDTAGCQTGCPFENRFDNRLERTATVHSTMLNEQRLFIQPVVKLGCKTSLTTGCIHDTAVCQSGCQTAFDNWLNVCIHDTTGC